MTPVSAPVTEPTWIERIRGAAARRLVRLPDGLQILLSGQPPVEVDGQTLDVSTQLLLALRPAREGLMDSGVVESRVRGDAGGTGAGGVGSEVEWGREAIDRSGECSILGDRLR